MTISSYENGFPNGVTLRNIPIVNVQQGTGKSFWVDSNHALASEYNSGKFTHPFKTLSQALLKCTPNQGDTIYIAAGHAEVLNQLNYRVNVEGISIIGLGQGGNSPKFTFTGAALGVAFVMESANVYMANINIYCEISVQQNMVIVEAKNVFLENIGLYAEDEALIPAHYLNLTGGSANASDGFRGRHIHIKGNPAVTTATAGIFMFQNIDDVILEDCTVLGAFTEGCVYQTTGGIEATNFRITGDGYYHNENAANVITMRGAKSGFISRGTVVRSDYFDKFIIETDEIGRGINGDVYMFVEDVIASTITTTGFELSDGIGGSFYVEDICIETDTTGLATGTNLIVEKYSETNAYGNVIFLEETIANLGATKTVTLDSASIIGHKGTASSGTKMRVRATGATLTGGTIRVSMKLRLIRDASSFERD